jgi:hypothetical protein
MYPLEIRFRYNSKLLNVEQKQEPINIDKLSKKKMKELLLKMMGKSST